MSDSLKNIADAMSRLNKLEQLLRKRDMLEGMKDVDRMSLVLLDKDEKQYPVSSLMEPEDLHKLQADITKILVDNQVESTALIKQHIRAMQKQMINMLHGLFVEEGVATDEEWRSMVIQEVV